LERHLLPDSLIFKPTHIVLDTNVLVADYWLVKPSSLLLAAFAKRTGAEIVVPRVVVEETKNKHKTHLDEALRQLEEARTRARVIFKKVSDLQGSELTLDFAPIGRAKGYPEFLDEKLKSLNSRIIDYCDIPQQSLIARALEKRRPFRNDDKGYRDAVIWESLLTLCTGNTTEIAFVSNDQDAFWDGNNVHPDLIADLDHRSFSKEKIRLFSNLPALADEHFLPFLTAEKDYLTLVLSGKLPGLNIEEEINSNLDTIIESINSKPELLRDDPDESEPQVTSIDSPTDLMVGDASQASDEIVVISFSFEVEVTFSFFVPHFDAYQLDEEYEHVLDWDWNESVVRAEGTRAVNISAMIAFDLTREEVESFEVEDLARNWTHWRDR
jgi:hypothetical protein